MSQVSKHSRLMPRDLQAMKGREKIACLTAYTAPMASLLDEYMDAFIVGDSLGMVLYGYDSTLPVTLELMSLHARAVVAHSSRACVIVDLPFGSYQESPRQAFRNAARLMQESGCQAVKLEGGMEMVETTAFLCERGIPVMAHIGLTPQHVNQLGGYGYQGKTEAQQDALRHQAQAFENAGACALLLEGIKASLAQEITQQSAIPTIGIGASPDCDGQVLVTEDMLGLFSRTPRFVKRYADLRSAICNAVELYKTEVKENAFPDTSHCFGKD